MKWWRAEKNCRVAADDTDDYTRRTRALDRLGILLGARVRRDVDLAPYTTYKVGGPASLFVTARNIDDLHAVSSALREQRVPLLVIGRGSNLLVSDDGFEGLALVLGEFAEEIVLPQAPAVPRVVAGGAVPLPVLARQCAARGLTGFEWGVGVPGSVGGAVRMNAGGHGSDIASSIEVAKIFHLGKGIVANVKASDLGLRFRGSDLGPELVVLSATFALSWGDKAASEAEMAEIVRWRREHQPGGQNAGSVFVNPEPGGGSSGAIIDRLGLRGFRIGSAEVSSKHANFIQCDPDGSADDVVAVMTHVRGRVRDELGIDLRSEVRLVGFDPQVAEAAGAARDDWRADARGVTTALDRVFGPLAGDETLSVVTIAPPLPDDAVAELAELFAPTGEIARPTSTMSSSAAPDSTPTSESSGATPSDSPSDSPTSATPGDTPVAPVVDISAAVTTTSAPRGPVVIDDTALRLPHERTEGSAAITVDDESRSGSVTIDPTSPFADPRTGVVDDDSLAAVIVDDRLTRRRLPRWLRVRRVSPLVALGIFIVLLSLTLVVLASPIFAVRRIEVTGLTYTDAVLLESVKESLNGASVFTADLDSAKRRLEGDPWVRSARLAWYLPDRVVIEIDERTPVAWFVGVDNRSRVLDREGRVLQVLEGQPTQFLKIEGVGPNLAAGTVTTPVYTGAAQLATSLPPDIAQRVKHLNVDGPEQLGMTLKTGTVVKLGAPVDLRYKLVIVATVLAQQDPKFIVSIDVSSGQAVVQNA